MADTSTTMLAAALACFDAGLCVVPVRADGSKAPYGAWKRHQRVRPSRGNITAWFGEESKHDGFGVITGAVSGGLEMLELEGRATNSGLGTQIAELADNSGLGELWARVCAGYLEITPTGGFHILYRVEGEVGGNTKLAADANAEVLIETRGEGGFTICAPSGGRTHPSGREWVLASGGPGTIATITADERDALHTLARAFDLTPLAAEAPAMPPPPRGGGLRPGDDYNARATWREILCPHGWMPLHTDSNGVTYWRRPGKGEGLSATTGRNEADNLYVFTTSTRFEAEKPYSKFAAYAVLEQNGDYSQAARVLASVGYGDQTRSQPLSDTFTTPRMDDEQGSGEGADEAENEAATPWHLSLAWALDGEPPVMPRPSIMAREDGCALFYKAMVNGVYGEPETAKSWVALCAGVEELGNGGRLAYVDADLNGQVSIVTRLLALGVPAEVIADPARFVLIEPHDVTDLHRAMPELEAWAADGNSPVVIHDSLGELLPMLGVSSESNDEVSTAMRFLTSGLVGAGAGIITIDHVPKNALGRNDNYAIGAQAKRRAIRGSYLATKKISEVAKGQVGEIALTISKDTNGALREVSPEGPGVFVLDASNPEALSWSVRLGGQESQKPTYLMEQVSRLLEAEGPCSARAIRTAVTGKTEHIMRAVSELVSAGHVSRIDGPRGSIVHHLNAIYREELEGLTASGSLVPEWFPSGSQNRDSVGRVVPPEGVSEAWKADATLGNRTSQADTHDKNDAEWFPSGSEGQSLSDSLLSSCTQCGNQTVGNPCEKCR